MFTAEELDKALPRRDERTIHLTKVLKKGPGDKFDAGVLGSMLGTGTIQRITEDGSLVFSFKPEHEAPARLPIRIGVGFPRPIQLRRLLRDLSNLGVYAIDLFSTDLGEKSYRDTKLLQDGGAHAALVEGAIQARDTSIPDIAVYRNVDAWLQSLCVMEDSTSSGPLLKIAADNINPSGAFSALSPHQGPVVLAVGAERGWSDRERSCLEADGFNRLSMGSRALRTETACMASVLLAMEKIGALL